MRQASEASQPVPSRAVSSNCSLARPARAARKDMATLGIESEHNGIAEAAAEASHIAPGARLRRMKMQLEAVRPWGASFDANSARRIERRPGAARHAP
jgi:hypothetical protein